MNEQNKDMKNVFYTEKLAYKNSQLKTKIYNKCVNCLEDKTPNVYHYCFSCFKKWEKEKVQERKNKGVCLIYDSDEEEELTIRQEDRKAYEESGNWLLK